MERLLNDIKEDLLQAITEEHASGILFSGGLDTSLVAYGAHGLPAINVRLEDYGQDIHYARKLSRHLGFELHERNVSVDEALAAIPEVIGITRSFDPAVPNDLPVYFGLQVAREKKYPCVLTGDGADEFFAGYGYMRDIDDLGSYIQMLMRKSTFNSLIIGKYMGVGIAQPFRNKRMLDAALSVPADCRIRMENGQWYGKWILRKAFENVLPAQFVWQSKRPLEYGSGMTALRDIIAAYISDEEYREAQKSLPVRFISKDHYYYYKIYRDRVGEIPNAGPGEASCPGCGTGIDSSDRHCFLCGWCT